MRTVIPGGGLVENNVVNSLKNLARRDVHYGRAELAKRHGAIDAFLQLHRTVSLHNPHEERRCRLKAQSAPRTLVSLDYRTRLAVVEALRKQR
jgi:hypothetical protein